MKNSFNIQFETFSSYEQFLRDAMGHEGIVVIDWIQTDNIVQLSNKTHRGALRQLLNKNKNWTIHANDNKRPNKKNRSIGRHAA